MLLKKKRKLIEAHTKSLAEQENKQLANIQKRSQEIKSAIEKGTVIQIESDVDKSIQKPSSKKESTKEYGSPSGAKSLGTRIEASYPPSPLKAKGKNIIHEDIFLEPKDDSQKILGNSIKEMKNI